MMLSRCLMLFDRVEWESKANNKAVEKSSFWSKSTIFGKFIYWLWILFHVLDFEFIEFAIKKDNELTEQFLQAKIPLLCASNGETVFAETYFFMLHHMHGMHRCSVLLQMSLIMWSVCWAHGWAVQKWVNQSRCHLGGGLIYVGPRNYVVDGVKIWQIHSQLQGITSQQCGLLPKYCGWLLYFILINIIISTITLGVWWQVSHHSAAWRESL